MQEWLLIYINGNPILECWVLKSMELLSILKFILAVFGFGLKTSSFILFLHEFKKNKAAKITKISGTILRIFLEVSVSIILVLF
jgi:hypothetical protein